jgi:hypothetical protein
MERRLAAGREYLQALQRLGFRPDALLWALKGKSAPPADFELLLVSSWADSIGPRRVYDLLFEAYDLSATPKEIDPFIVSLFSPATQVAIDLAGSMHTIRTEMGMGERPMFVLGMFDYSTIPPWIIHYAPRKVSRFDDARHFQAFSTNIERLAA